MQGDDLFVPSFPETRANLTHYCLVDLGQGPVVAGEAEHVRQIEEGKWEAHVVLWGVNRETMEFDPNAVSEVRWMTVRAPTLILIPKADFRGQLRDTRVP